MTFSQKRRLLYILDSLMFDFRDVIYFTIGVIFALFLMSHPLLEAFEDMDKSGLSLCKVDKNV